MIEDIETIAEAVHNSWWEKKIKHGFHHPSKCDKVWEPTPYLLHCTKCNFDMIPYDQLTEKDKEYDRVTVRTVLKALEKTGHKIL